MKATEANFLQFLHGNNKQFIIPIYQRTYSWTIAQCRQLWEDILRVAQEEHIPSHFVGSIVYISKGIISASAIQEFLVIDGQQRLTTLSLLLVALAKAIEKAGEPAKEATQLNLKKITNYYLLNNDEDGLLQYRLLLTQSDRETLMKLVNGYPLPANASPRIAENYQYFERVVAESNVPLETIITGIRKLVIVDVSLDRTQDNPQLIFESLNSTGLALSQADLIRNYILMGLETREQTDLYTNYWFPMEQGFGHAEDAGYFDRFMRDYLTIKNNGHIPNIDRVYVEFKTYVHSHPDLTMRAIVADIYRYAKHFIALVFEKDLPRDVLQVVKDINTLKVEVAYPFLLETLDDYEQGVLTQDGLLAILKTVESYIFRRVICAIPTNSLNKTFATLTREINKDRYLESVQAALLIKDSYRRFPGDEELRQQFVIKDVYNFRPRLYMLRKLENFQRTKELINVDEYTIEHIMPQNEDLSAEWRNELGANWQQIHERYLHTIGNLTLTGYNSEYSDRTFKEKRDYPDRKGFHNSPLFLNEYLAGLDHWNEETIQTRAGMLADLAVQIWAYPKLSEETIAPYRLAQNKGNGDSEPRDYPMEHYEYLQEGPMLALFKAFRHRVLNLDPIVREEHKKLYIAFKATTNFVDVVPQKVRLRLSLNLPFTEIDDPKGLCVDVSNRGRWGNGDIELGLSTMEELDYVMDLVMQAFDWQMGNE